ncbi:phosphoadenosine phosphosulfate reductase family protein [Ensifer sp. ENS09]|uniref:phosphoadenosine phosphosulfate reductase domain-containing protein n=1 Tax=Ensifer sp. ENS09 TaxID=2769263 RepID=UPI00178310AD|nr:phosphoadenosine phosphosulfate reductase family protein [Ensifer sp. ENS09]MBD9652014.1 phosphoadenosine phosphosulfate reductase family protein [Ensifer sp. ENS09]
MMNTSANYRVLVACEFSGTVRNAFSARGYDAWSCDLLPSEDGSNRHIVGDARDFLDDGWDLLIVAHPPCTRLCNSGVRWLTKPPRGKTLEQMWAELDEGAALFSDFWNAPIARIAIESWSVEDVFAYADRFGIPRNTLYALGFTRVGCFPCVMCRKEEMRLIGTRFPEHVDRLANWEALVSDVSKRGNSTFFNVTDDPLLADGWQSDSYDWSLSRTGIRARVEWSKTSRGGLQYDAFVAAAENFGTSCNEWGACE